MNHSQLLLYFKAILEQDDREQARIALGDRQSSSVVAVDLAQDYTESRI